MDWKWLSLAALLPLLCGASFADENLEEIQQAHAQFVEHVESSVLGEPEKLGDYWFERSQVDLDPVKESVSLLTKYNEKESEFFRWRSKQLALGYKVILLSWAGLVAPEREKLFLLKVLVRTLQELKNEKSRESDPEVYLRALVGFVLSPLHEYQKSLINKLGQKWIALSQREPELIADQRAFLAAGKAQAERWFQSENRQSTFAMPTLVASLGVGLGGTVLSTIFLLALATSQPLPNYLEIPPEFEQKARQLLITGSALGIGAFSGLGYLFMRITNWLVGTSDQNRKDALEANQFFEWLVNDDACTLELAEQLLTEADPHRDRQKFSHSPTGN